MRTWRTGRARCKSNHRDLGRRNGRDGDGTGGFRQTRHDFYRPQPRRLVVRRIRQRVEARILLLQLREHRTGPVRRQQADLPARQRGTQPNREVVAVVAEINQELFRRQFCGNAKDIGDVIGGGDWPRAAIGQGRIKVGVPDQGNCRHGAQLPKFTPNDPGPDSPEIADGRRETREFRIEAIPS